MHLMNYLMRVLRDIGFDLKDLSTIAFFGMTVIQIAPIRIDPWSFVLTKLGTFLNRTVLKELKKTNAKVEDIEKSLYSLQETTHQREAIQARRNIVEFGDSLFRDNYRSQDSFEQALDDIDYYERYCLKHPEFKNNQTVITSNVIKEIYRDCLKRNQFDDKKRKEGK